VRRSTYGEELGVKIPSVSKRSHFGVANETRGKYVDVRTYTDIVRILLVK
jgi:hypothetical protein